MAHLTGPAETVPACTATEVLQETVLVVPGMHCAGCMGKVERALNDLEQVASARTNLSARHVRIMHAPTIAMPDLVAALERSGFASQLRESELAGALRAVTDAARTAAVAGLPA